MINFLLAGEIQGFSQNKPIVWVGLELFSYDKTHATNL